VSTLRVAIGLAVAIDALAGCGRLGYDRVVTSQSESDGGSRADAGAPVPLDADVDVAAIEPATDGSAPDLAPAQVDAAPSPEVAADVARDVVADVARDVVADVAGDVAGDVVADLALDVTGIDVGPACVSFPSADLIADFEDGLLRTNRVGTRGGPSFTVVQPSYGTITNVVMAFCGQRVMQVQPIGSPPSVLVQAHFLLTPPGGPTPFLDARAFKGIAVVLRASAPVTIRLKLPTDETLATGSNDHFRVSVDVGTGWSHSAHLWGAFRQAGTGPPVSFDVGELFAVEISADLPPGERLWIDTISFTR
jgi:hypothetical protein